MTNHIQETPAGVIDWKMEALRSARLLADAERIIAEYKAQAIEAARQPSVYEAMEAALEMSKPSVERMMAAVANHSPPVFHAPHNYGERLPSGNAAEAGGEAMTGGDTAINLRREVRLRASVNVRWIIIAGPDGMCFIEERTSDARGKTSFGPMPNEDAVPFIQERKLQYVVDYTLVQTTPAPPPRPEPSQPFCKG